MKFDIWASGLELELAVGSGSPVSRHPSSEPRDRISSFGAAVVDFCLHCNMTTYIS